MIKIFSAWKDVSWDLKLKGRDVKLPRNVYFLIAVIYLSAFIDIILSYLTSFPVYKSRPSDYITASDFVTSAVKVQNLTNSFAVSDTGALDPLHAYFIESHQLWAIYVPYHPTLALLLFMLTLISYNAWNFADIIIITFSRALYFKFKTLAIIVDERLVKCQHRLKGNV